MNLSYWEHNTWFSDVDYTIVGSGIVGLNCALRLREIFPSAKIVLLEKGSLPQGASTKNAGFACFGSISEIIDDLKSHTEAEVLDLVRQRLSGLKWLRKTLGDDALDYQALGGYELFTVQDEVVYNECLARIQEINTLLHPIFGADVYSEKPNEFGFENIQPKAIFNAFEGQIDTGKMMQALLRKVQTVGVQIINSCEVKKYTQRESTVHIETEHFSFETQQLCIATNGFAQAMNIEQVKPARAQVLVTKPIPNLTIAGTFHLDKGYYYFRNIHNRILFGGGRNLDFKAEETTTFGQTALVQDHLEHVLKTVILPNTPFEIDRRWSGIMGVGNQKKPILKTISPRVHCGVRLGGMGVAIGSQVGRDLASMIV